MTMQITATVIGALTASVLLVAVFQLLIFQETSFWVWVIVLFGAGSTALFARAAHSEKNRPE
ncbi:hypothetical protein [Microbacterium sp. MM2322]|uniref:hypothetical protein n=1 Tax=Microbacterium sp. MM2322 TaxID=3157631 RepID=UPI0032D57F8D